MMKLHTLPVMFAFCLILRSADGAFVPVTTETETTGETTGYVVSPTVDGAAPFTVAFDIAKGLNPGEREHDQELYTTDQSEGAFRFTCGGDGPVKFDDPVLYPGQPGRVASASVMGE